MIGPRQICTTDTALEQHIATDNKAAGRIVKGHMAGRVAGYLQHLQYLPGQRQLLPALQVLHRAAVAFKRQPCMCGCRP